MGTNYYWSGRHSGSADVSNSEALHIGTESWGWRFLFHGADGIRSWDDWKALIKRGGVIYDDYKRVVSADVLCEIVEKGMGREHTDFCLTCTPRPHHRPWRDEHGFYFTEDEFRRS